MFDFASAKSASGRRGIIRRAIDRLLPRLVGDGGLTLRYPDGSETEAGNGPGLLVEIKTWRAARRILLDPGLNFGEAFMDGTLVPLGCTVFDVLDMLLAARRREGLGPINDLREAIARAAKRINQFNPASRARRNVAHHYDLGLDFYRLLLDEDLQYSCAYFATGQETLAQAQIAKKQHIAKKLLLDRPGLRVLDIGCGWGGMALTLARDYDADVTGITLSREQLETARARAEQAGLSHRVRFELLDYRAVPLTFDRIVSVGMFEHVGINHYAQYFEVVNRCLEPGGVALIHSIGRSYGPNATNPWLQRYIFPGGYSPALSEVMPAVEKSGLITTDIEILRLHYAKTLACWRENLERYRDEITRLYDERFARMFEFYLSGAELGFRHSGYMIWQLQLARQHGAVPLTRDYISR